MNQPKQSLYHTYQMMLNMAGSHRIKLKKSLVLIALSAAIQGIAFASFIPIFLAIQKQNYLYAILWMTILTVLLLISSLLRWKGQDFDYSGDMPHASLELQSQLGEKLRSIPQEKLSEYRSGDMDNTLSANVEQVLSYSITMSILVLNAILIPITATLTLLFFDWRIAMILAVVFLLIVPLYRWRRPTYAKDMSAVEYAHAQFNAELIEFVQGIAVLRSSMSLDQQSSKIQKTYQKLQECQESGHRKSAKPTLIITSVVELALLTCLSVGLIWVLNGSLSVMFLAALIAIVVRFSEPLGNFVSMFAIFEIMNSASQRVMQFQKIQPLAIQEPKLIPNRFDIKFEHVDFQYQSQKEIVLKNINLNIPENSFTALVGASGCGKSTLTKLITRYADPQQGRITIGGIDIRSIPTQKLMDLVSVVFQDVYLFQDSIFNNIRMGNKQATEQDVITAAKQAQCHDFIEALPHGYQTQVAELGGNFSGGEKQRISIARALLKNSPIVILDEPTASLDVFSEVAVQKAINTLVKNKTVVVIAHRLTTVARADKIIVLDQGSILEQGNHDTLLAQNGRYAKLWHFQQGVRHE